MLKKKMKSFFENHLESNDVRFEVISDQSASRILGGLLVCNQLVACGEYSGVCPNLELCRTYYPNI